MSERARLAAIHEGRTHPIKVRRYRHGAGRISDAATDRILVADVHDEANLNAVLVWERTYGPLLELWHEASWLVGIWADSIQRGSALREDILALRRALAAVEAAAKEVPE